MYSDPSVSFSSTPGPVVDPAFAMFYMFFWLALALVLIASLWKIFTKAGQPGWAAIIPIYNYYIMLKIVGRPVWWLLLFLIPFVNIVIAIIIALDLAKVFGKSTVFGIFGLIIFGWVGYPMLGFGKAQYQGVDASSTTPPPAPPPATPVAS